MSNLNSDRWVTPAGRQTGGHHRTLPDDTRARRGSGSPPLPPIERTSMAPRTWRRHKLFGARPTGAKRGVGHQHWRRQAARRRSALTLLVIAQPRSRADRWRALSPFPS